MVKANSDFHISDQRRFSLSEEYDECPDLGKKGESWQSSLNEAVAKIVEAIEETGREYARILELTTRLRSLETAVTELSKSGSIIVPISTFDPEPFDLLKEIKVVVRPRDDEFVATFFDANVNASGCNETDAVDNLKGALIRRFDHLDKMPPEKLGPAMAKQIAVLRTLIRRRS
jgi:hypothetical protein